MFVFSSRGGGGRGKGWVTRGETKEDSPSFLLLRLLYMYLYSTQKNQLLVLKMLRNLQSYFLSHER